MIKVFDKNGKLIQTLDREDFLTFLSSKDEIEINGEKYQITWTRKDLTKDKTSIGVKKK